MDMILTLIAGFCLIGIEIWVDTLLWKRKLNDKPFTTIVWLILVMVLSLFLPGWYHHNALLLASQRALFFSPILNIVRWKKLEYYQWQTPMGQYTKKRTFTEKLFYHGTPEKLKKMSIFKWDKFISTVSLGLWWAELFFTGLAFASAILIRYNWSIIDEIWHLIINLFA